MTTPDLPLRHVCDRIITKEDVRMPAITLVSSEGAPSRGPAVSHTLKFREPELVPCVFISASGAVLTPGVTEGHRPGFHHFSFGDICSNLRFECIGFPPPSESSTPLVMSTLVTFTDMHGGRGVVTTTASVASFKDNQRSQTEIKKPNPKKIDQT